MSTVNYRSDAIYKDAVLKYYVIAWFGSLGIVMITAVSLVLLYEGDCRQGYKLALAILPAVHVVAWLIIANLMCAQFTLMSRYPTRLAPPAGEKSPSPEDTNREIPFVKGEKTATINWE